MVRAVRGASRSRRPAPTSANRPIPHQEGRRRSLGRRGRIRQGAHVEDRRTTFSEYLDRRLRWWESDHALKPSTLNSYREAIELYFRPGLGHVRLTDLRDYHFRDLYAAMRLINRPDQVTSHADAGVAELLRRLTDARATAPHLPSRLASTRPLSEARLKSVHAVARAGLADLVPQTLPHNPAAAVKLGGKRGARKTKPLMCVPHGLDRCPLRSVPRLT
jgi:hypothetical protein